MSPVQSKTGDAVREVNDHEFCNGAASCTWVFMGVTVVLGAILVGAAQKQLYANALGSRSTGDGCDD